MLIIKSFFPRKASTFSAHPLKVLRTTNDMTIKSLADVGIHREARNKKIFLT